jgi:hypothetical protein
MLTRILNLRLFITFCGLLCLGASTGLAQSSVGQFPKVFHDATDVAALEEGQPVVKLLPTQDKREVAVFGLVNLQVTADAFLKSFRESMVRRSDPAILEIGSFSTEPTLDDLQNLTFENRDIEDLKECVVGNCKLKLSAAMIERLHNEIDWAAPDYKIRATQLLKLMFVDYVRDYLRRGDVALIEYNDKPIGIRLAEEQRALMAGSNSIYDGFLELPQNQKQRPESGVAIVDNKIVWSKIKYGLKPVIAINHILIYTRHENPGSQVLIVSKQIYANHYFDSSLALTAFGSIPGANSGSYLFYENRSRLDGLTGAFGKFKRGIVEDQAVDGLRAILEKSKVNFSARASSPLESETNSNAGKTLKRWLAGGIKLFSWLFLITAFVALLALSGYSSKGALSGEAPHE